MLRRRHFLACAAVLTVAGSGRGVLADPLVRDQWQVLAASLHGRTRPEQAVLANRIVHLRVGYVADANDEWSTPFETLARGAGDCEDFAVAKYALLRCAGRTDEEVKVAYGRTHAFGAPLAHMVTLVFDGQDPLVLDNLGDDPRPLSARRDLELRFALSENRVWAHERGVFSLHTERLHRFERLMRDMRNEGSLPTG